MLKFVPSIRVIFAAMVLLDKLKKQHFYLLRCTVSGASFWSSCVGILPFYTKGCVNGMCALGMCCVFSKAQYSNPSNQWNPHNDLILFGMKLRYNKKRQWWTGLSLYMFRSLAFQLYLKTSWRLRSQWGIYRRISSMRL